MSRIPKFSAIKIFLFPLFSISHITLFLISFPLFLFHPFRDFFFQNSKFQNPQITISSSGQGTSELA